MLIDYTPVARMTWGLRIRQDFVKAREYGPVRCALLQREVHRQAEIQDRRHWGAHRGTHSP